MPRTPNQNSKALVNDLVLLRRIRRRIEEGKIDQPLRLKAMAGIRTAIEILEAELVR